MATIQNFTELRCWQEARLIAKDVYLLAQSGLFGKDYGLRDQVQRAVVSIGSNIAEGFERGSNAELVKFLSYAKGSAGEVMSQLYTAFDVGYISQEDLDGMVTRLKNVGAIIARFQVAVRHSNVRGLMYKSSQTEVTGRSF